MPPRPSPLPQELHITCGSGGAAIRLARDEAGKITHVFQADTTNNPTINPIPTNHTNDRKIAQSAR